MSDPLITALLGQDPRALTEDVSLATPLTSSRITGRDAVAAALGAYADVIGATDADLRLKERSLKGPFSRRPLTGTPHKSRPW
jgi:hypothetical protein